VNYSVFNVFGVNLNGMELTGLTRSVEDVRNIEKKKNWSGISPVLEGFHTRL
jgi:hypothetical protein